MATERPKPFDGERPKPFDGDLTGAIASDERLVGRDPDNYSYAWEDCDSAATNVRRSAARRRPAGVIPTPSNAQAPSISGTPTRQRRGIVGRYKGRAPQPPDRW